MILGRGKVLRLQQPSHALKDPRPLQNHLREDNERNHQHLELYVCVCTIARVRVCIRVHVCGDVFAHHVLHYSLPVWRLMRRVC